MGNAVQKRKAKLKTGDWAVKVQVWQCLARTPKNRSAIQRELELHAGEEGYADHPPDKATIAKICDELRTLSPELILKLPSEVQAYAQKEKPELEAELRQLKKPVPHEDTKHKRKMHKLAMEVSKEIDLPSPSDNVWWRDFPVEFTPGKYDLPIGSVEISENGQIKVSYHALAPIKIEPHIVKGFDNHLITSGIPKFTELVEDKKKLEDLAVKYSEAFLLFLKLIVDETRRYRTKIHFKEGEKPGLTKYFILMVWNDAILKATGYSRIDDSWYKCETAPDSEIKLLRCGAYCIGIARSEKTLKKYENWHKELRAKYAEHPSIKKIVTRDKELRSIREEIEQRLKEFSDTEPLPEEHCDLCSPSRKK
jgi:hypothetical protein